MVTSLASVVAGAAVVAVAALGITTEGAAEGSAEGADEGSADGVAEGTTAAAGKDAAEGIVVLIVFSV
jgi:hypothetical protein